MRVTLSCVLFGAGVMGLAVCVAFGADVLQSHQRAVAKGDFAGYSLGLHFLLYALMPATLSLLLGGCLLNPPVRLLERLRRDTFPSPSAVRKALIGLCLGGAVVILLGVVAYVGRSLAAAAGYYRYGPGGLAMILLQNLLFSAPLLILGALLAWAGRALKRWGPEA